MNGVRRNAGGDLHVLSVLSGAMAVAFTGVIYFATVFALAFVLGVARTLVVAPNLGATTAVVLELPVALAASWVAARGLLHNRHFGLMQRAAMGSIAFALLIVSEALLAGVLRGQSVSLWATEIATPLGLMGMGGQIGFAAIPILIGGD